MTLEQKIGQMLMIGFSGAEMNTKLGSEIRGAGGVGLFNLCPPPKESNITSPKQLKKLCADIQASASIPMFIAADQEGGRVARLSEKNGFLRPPSPKEMASKDSVAKEYRAIARTLRGCGINMNFAPCCDVDTYPKNPIIGALGRSFSGNENTAASCAFEAWQAQKKEGIISCLKHFPGHGSSREDTHLGMADLTASFEERELHPFRFLIALGFNEFILSAHLVHKGFSPLPASLAPEYAAILRAWGFQGLIVTDDLKMGAIEKEFGLEDALILAVNAGADVLAYFNNLAPYKEGYPAEAKKILLKAVQDKKIPESRIEESCSRILAFKKEKIF